MIEDEERLFAVCLGGRAERCNTELHDVVFVVGRRIEDTYEQLLDKWFGLPRRLHIDAWVALETVDGFRVSLAREPADGPAKLWFVNLGAYRPGEFSETHANIFVVCDSADAAKARAKAALLRDGVTELHTDDLFEVDSCMPIEAAGGRHIVLTPAPGPPTSLNVNSSYHPLPKPTIEDWIARHPERGL